MRLRLKRQCVAVRNGRCGFVKNKFGGPDRCGAEFTVEDILSDGNKGGEIAIGAESKRTVTNAMTGGAQAFGLAVKDHSNATSIDLSAVTPSQRSPA
jgi:hypothetical protein